MYSLEKIIPDRLTKAMGLRKMNQKMLSDVTGIKPCVISGYVTGRYAPRHEKLRLIAEALNVNETWLIGLADEMDVCGPMQPIDCIDDIYSGMTVYDIKNAKRCRINHINRDTQMISLLYPFRGRHCRRYVKFVDNRFFRQ